MQRTQNTKTVLKKNKFEGLNSPILKLAIKLQKYKATEIKTV